MRKNLSELVSFSAGRTIRPRWMIWLWGIVVLAQLGQGALYWTYSGPDRNRQLLAAKSWVEGHGLSEPYFDKESGSTLYQDLVSWAPGYSVVAGGLFMVLKDWTLVAQVLSSLSILLVFVGLWVLLRKLRGWLSWQQEAFLLIFWMMAFPPFRHFTDTDSLALGAVLLGSVWLLDSRSWKNVAAVTMLLLAAWFRIAYVPMLLLPSLVLWAGSGKWIPGKWVMISGFGGLLGILAYWWLLRPSHPVSGGVEDMVTASGWYPENWLSWDAFPVKSWLYVSAEGVSNKLGSLAGMGAGMVLLILSGSILVIFSNDVIGRKSKSGTGFQAFLILTATVIGLTCLELGWLSLRTPPEIHDGARTWTYVQETRYYAWSLILLAIWIVNRVGELKESGIRRMLKRWLPLAVLAFGWGHGVIRHGVAMLSPTHAATRWSQPEQELKAFYQQVKAMDQPVWIVPGESIYSRDKATLGCLAGAVLVYPGTAIPDTGAVIYLD